jgi:hypothetical protein
MGSVNSTNLVESTVSAMISSLNSASTNCPATTQISQIASITAGPECTSADVHIDGVSFDATGTVDATCLATVSQKNDVSATIEQVAKQQAESISQQLSLNLGSTNATNIARLTSALGVSVSNVVSLQVSAAAASQQAAILDLHAKGSCRGSLANITAKSIQQAVAKGVLDSGQAAKAKADLKQAIDQEAHAKMQSLLMIIVAIVALVVCGIILAIVLKGGKKNNPANVPAQDPASAALLPKPPSSPMLTKS